MNSSNLKHNNKFYSAYLTVSETAEYTGLSEGTIRKFLKDPIIPLPHYKVGTTGRFIRIKKKEIDRWLYFYKPEELDRYFGSIENELVS
ncbi:MAG: helix-turn-helix domain-containing protein [Desulfobacula sp.]|nr:helix-turn-helix domain-containing protein [Desulfobacula sp.]